MCVFVDIESDTDDEQKKKLGIKTKRKTVVIFLLSTLAANGQWMGEKNPNKEKQKINNSESIILSGHHNSR